MQSKIQYKTIPSLDGRYEAGSDGSIWSLNYKHKFDVLGYKPKVKSHCKRGHKLGGDNIYPSQTSRSCRKCHLTKARARLKLEERKNG